MSINKKVLKVNISEKKGTTKKSVPKIKLIENFGVENDAHAGAEKRQISLLAIESINKVNTNKISLIPGDFAENITTLGIILNELPIGTKLKIGKEVILEVTQIGKTCHTKCEIFKLVGNCIMPKEGIFAKVINGGYIESDDLIEILF